MFSLREGITQYGTPQGVKRDFGALATSAPGPKRMNAVPGWNWSADQPAASNAPGANALHSVNVLLVDATGYDAETLYGHPIFTVRSKEAHAATALTLDGLNEFLLGQSQEDLLTGSDAEVAALLKKHEVRFAGFFAAFTPGQMSVNARTFVLVVGGLHEVRVPLSENLEKNQWLQLFFEASVKPAETVQAALAKRGRVAGIMPKMTGKTVHVAARFQSLVPPNDRAFGAGHIAHVRTRYAAPGGTDVDAACGGPKGPFVHGLGLHVRPAWPRANLYQ